MTQKKPYVGIVKECLPNREKGMTFSTEDWLLGKQMCDGAEGLWRIHDDIYDFSDFVKNHPGGKYWLEITKGTDITEAFESHHVSEKAENMLKKFRVKKAKTPRASLVTFHENGFYRTLKRKVRKANVVKPTGSTWQSRLISDMLLLGFLVVSLMGVKRSYWWAVAAGVILNMLSVAAHNFFHMKDNVRMYYFNFSLLSFRDWRISHALSHHQFANTLLDLEISLFEPVFQYLPKEDKSLLTSYLSWAVSPFVFGVLFYIEFIKRIVKIVKGQRNFYWDEFLAFTVPLLMWILTNECVGRILTVWNVILLTSSFAFMLIGLTAAHHHPDIYHEGDYLGDDKDFGLLQLAAVRDRVEINGNFFLTMITFGDHALHHFFPTVDHWKLQFFHPYLEETCREFNIDYTPTTCGNLAKGMYQQLARNYVNGRLFIDKAKEASGLVKFAHPTCTNIKEQGEWEYCAGM